MAITDRRYKLEEGSKMIYAQKISVSFDPVKEAKAAALFKKAHPEWNMSETTIATTFEQEEFWSLKLEEANWHDKR